MKTKILFTSLLLGVSTIINATTIDFDSASISSAVTYTEQGVIFSTPGGFFSSSGTPNSTLGILGDNPRQEYRADIAGGAGFVSVDLGDYGNDLDNIYLKAFDSSDNLLASTSQFCCSITEMITLALTTANISYALFGSAGGTYPHSVYADNFTYRGGVPQVPLPAALFMFAPALLGFLGLRRRAKNNVA